MINMHIRFVTELTKRILVHMKENGYGRILNVGSTGSFIPSPTDAVYSATKAYIMSFSNALCGELGKAGIKVTTLCPGATETEFAAKAKHSKYIAIQDCSYEAGKSSGDRLSQNDERKKAGYSGDI